MSDFLLFQMLGILIYGGIVFLIIYYAIQIKKTQERIAKSIEEIAKEMKSYSTSTE